jgi:general secretion pathway protein F
MGTFRYRAATAAGELKTGLLDGTSKEGVFERLRRQGLRPIDAAETASAAGAARGNGALRQAVANAIGELAVLLNAGLALDRALAVCVQNIQEPALKAAFAGLQARVKEGAPLSLAMADQKGFFPPMASAMAEAGEANGRLGEALSRLAESLDRAEALRQTIVSSLVYPAVLAVVATGVIGVMLLFVVPQFEGLFADAKGKLPFMTQLVMGASDALRSYGWAGALGLAAAVFGVRQWLRSPAVRLGLDRWILTLPQLGPLVARAETAAFARTLGSLVDGGVPLPQALTIAQRSVANTHMAAAIGEVAAGLKRGGGLTGPLAATGLFPPMAISFLRTGEETARLGLMLARLADVLDRNVRTSIQRLISILTPAITVAMGAAVATVIASIMSAIIGFNDLALTS